MIERRSLHTQPAPETQLRLEQHRAIDRRRGQGVFRHVVGIVAGEVVAVDVLSSVAGLRVVVVRAAAGGLAEGPLARGGPAGVGVEREADSQLGIGRCDFDLDALLLRCITTGIGG